MDLRLVDCAAVDRRVCALPNEHEHVGASPSKAVGRWPNLGGPWSALARANAAVPGSWADAASLATVHGGRNAPTQTWAASVGPNPNLSRSRQRRQPLAPTNKPAFVEFATNIDMTGGAKCGVDRAALASPAPEKSP